MARYRYLNCSELVAARWLASEALRRRRPRRAARARMYVTHPARDLAPLALAVRQWISQTTPPSAPAPVMPSPPVPSGTGGTTPVPFRVPEPRTSPDLWSGPPATPAALSAPGTPAASVLVPNPVTGAVTAPASEPTPLMEPVAESVPGSGFSAALASRSRIQALRAGGRSRADTRTRPGSPTAKQRAAARLRARTAAFRTTTHLTADRDGLWKDAMAAARMAKGHLRRAA
ncbi:hypothetical protein [Nocardiopsis sp. CC223A]|uniref:hypothetical protein n=1 Tax=Nocardiopsis sp. CC223A TaxID=3044051 RepID=UPI00278C5B12|nr:hypothetical protein [Nocardiopsis sp. CC223A]